MIPPSPLANEPDGSIRLYAIIDLEAITTMITLKAWIWSRRTNQRAVKRCNEKKIYPTIQHGSANDTTKNCSSSWCWTKCPYASVRSPINQNKIPNVRYNNVWPCVPRKPYRCSCKASGGVESSNRYWIMLTRKLYYKIYHQSISYNDTCHQN